MTSKQFFNFLTQDNGAKVIECSSASMGSSAEHVLQNMRKVVRDKTERVAF